MDVDVIFKIAGIGILTAVVGQILKNSGKDDISTLATLAGVVIVLFMVVGMIGDLFSNLKSIFSFVTLPFM
ncbi:MAG: stage III sporulation protein AC [Clostridia bacterium]|nr:stage III sporulation protein AC [Clostridia bacterium]